MWWRKAAALSISYLHQRDKYAWHGRTPAGTCMFTAYLPKLGASSSLIECAVYLSAKSWNAYIWAKQSPHFFEEAGGSWNLGFLHTVSLNMFWEFEEITFSNQDWHPRTPMIFHFATCLTKIPIRKFLNLRSSNYFMKTQVIVRSISPNVWPFRLFSQIRTLTRRFLLVNGLVFITKCEREHIKT
jgi:hypothetical protein